MKALDLEVMHQTDPPEIPWVVEGLVARRALTLFVGDGGLGKSLFMLAAASAVTRGEYIAGMRTTGGGVVLVDAENGEDEIHRRVVKYGLRNNAYVFEGDGFRLAEPGCLGRLADYMARSTTRLVILDSMASMWDGDENDRSQVQAALEPLRELARDYDCGVVLLHHTNKTGNIFRGSGAMKNVPEIMVMMGTGYMGGRRDKNQDRRWLKWEKCRMGRAPARKWFEFTREGVVESRAPSRDELWEREF